MNLWAATIILFLIAPFAVAQSDATPQDFFESHVRPILSERCIKCHGPEQQKAGLRLDSREAMLKGSAKNVVANLAAPESSKLLFALGYAGEPKMPPDAKLQQEDIDAIAQWLRMGAPWPDAKPLTATVASLESRIATARKTHWAFRRVEAPKIPQPTDTTFVRNDIDRIVQAHLAEQGLKPSPPADRRTLIRRAYFDLIGLPPTDAAVEAFEHDPDPDAFDRVVDDLLALPHYGERWGRHWLDLARYSDTKGYVFQEERTYPYSHTYRDFVIRAFNEDIPYDTFIKYQLAADQMDLGADKRPLAAMGFLTLGRRFINNIHDITDDRIDVVSRGLLGLTTSCARCHDHKFDPIGQADYYAMYGVFRSAEEPAEGPLIETPDPKNPKYQEFQKAVADAQANIEHVTDELHTEMLASVRGQAADYLLTALEAKDADEAGVKIKAKDHKVLWQIALRWRDYLAKRRDAHDPVLTAWFAYAALPAAQFAALAPKLAEQIASGKVGETPVNARVAEAFKGDAPKNIAEVAERYRALFASAESEWGKFLATRAQAATQSGAKSLELPAGLPDGNIEAIRQVLYGAESPCSVKRAEVYDLSEVPKQDRIKDARNNVLRVQATHPGRPDRAMAMQESAKPFDPYIFKRGKPEQPGDKVPRRFFAVLSDGPPKPFEHGSGRIDLANAIASPTNPLTARVFVNRVWMHHFGAPLVDTPSDFGVRTPKPAESELLDYLAWRFVQDGWSIKKLHRLILQSHTYQQASDENPEAEKHDPEDRLLWRQNRQRLEFEAMRDSLLAASGNIDLSIGGHPIDIFAEPFSMRRSVYAFIERQNLPGLFRTFDFAIPDAHSPRRANTTVPQQALFFMNSPFAVQQARNLLGRAQIQAASDPGARIHRLYELLFQREPAQEEERLAKDFLAKAAAISLPTASVWQYGYGNLDMASKKLDAFTSLPNFTDSRYAGGMTVPDAKLGWVMLSAGGGHPGAPGIAAIRRWIAPEAGFITISGALHHDGAMGDGVLASIVSSRGGVLWSGAAKRSVANAHVDPFKVEPGDTLDFIVACGADNGYDSFSWAPHIALSESLKSETVKREWDANTDFGPPPPPPLNPWERYAQALLMTNEFVFVD